MKQSLSHRLRIGMLIVAIVSGGFAVPAMAASAQNPSGRPNADPNWLRTQGPGVVPYCPVLR